MKMKKMLAFALAGALLIGGGGKAISTAYAAGDLEPGQNSDNPTYVEFTTSYIDIETGEKLHDEEIGDSPHGVREIDGYKYVDAIKENHKVTYRYQKIKPAEDDKTDDNKKKPDDNKEKQGIIVTVNVFGPHSNQAMETTFYDSKEYGEDKDHIR